MKDKKSFVLRMDTELFAALEKWAQDEFRSVNGQIEWLITKQLKENNRWKNHTNKLQKDVAIKKSED